MTTPSRLPYRLIYWWPQETPRVLRRATVHEIWDAYTNLRQSGCQVVLLDKEEEHDHAFWCLAPLSPADHDSASAAAPAPLGRTSGQFGVAVLGGL